MMPFTPTQPPTPPAIVHVQATAQPAAPGRFPADPSMPSRSSAPAGAPQAPPDVGQKVTSHTGAPGMTDTARSSMPPAGRVAPASDNGGTLASPDVPGGTNHAPVMGAKPGSFSAPIKRD